MAYNDDSVLARLSSLNESHDSIATAAQWIMFHRRHADRTVQLWMQRLKDSSSAKRLSLMYLANEVVQQSRIRHKEDFVISFSPVVAEATSLAYKGAPAEIQAKLRRVVDVWKDRSIFELPIQKAIEARLEGRCSSDIQFSDGKVQDGCCATIAISRNFEAKIFAELDKARGAPRSGFGGLPFGNSSVPTELAPLVTSHQKVTKFSAPLTATTTSAIEEYNRQLDPEITVPSAPVYAARLNGLLKMLANAENAVAECVKARQDLVSSLEKLLDTNRDALARDKITADDLRGRKKNIEDKKQQVEVAIMRALGPVESNGAPRECDVGSPAPEPNRPEMEALTPPSMEDDLSEMPLKASDEGGSILPTNAITSGNQGLVFSHQSIPVSTNGSNKRRRIENSGDSPDLADDDDIDAEVAQMLLSSGLARVR